MRAESEYRRRTRPLKKGRPVPEGTAHGHYVYTEYGCRCEPCRAAHSVVMKEWRRRRKIERLRVFFEERQRRARAS